MWNRRRRDGEEDDSRRLAVLKASAKEARELLLAGDVPAYVREEAERRVRRFLETSGSR
jgi:hypothetical protein